MNTYVHQKYDIDHILLPWARPQLFNLLKDALDNYGAWIAGGFARSVAGQLFVSEQRMIDADVVADHFKHDGDIDLFFPSPDKANEFIVYLASKGINCKQSLTGVAFNFEICNGMMGMIKCQIIVDYSAPIRDVLSTFDIANCKVAFNHTGFLFDDRWDDIERSATLLVDNWNNPWTFSRVYKYINRCNFKAFADESFDKMFDVASLRLAVYDQPECRHSSPAKKAKKEGKYRVWQAVKCTLLIMSNEQLVRSIDFFIDPKFNCELSERCGYNFAIAELKNRLNPEHVDF